MTLELDGRVALVTGAARGLGRAEALALARRGARVVAIDLLDASETVHAIEGAGGVAAHATIDLAQGETAAHQALDVAISTFGDLHMLVNNAGVLRDRMSFNLTSEDWDLVLAVNLSASFHLARAAARHWRQQHVAGEPQPRSIVSTSSESGLYGNAGQANYAAAKAGVAALTITLATELERYGVRVNAIAPRARTQMTLDSLGQLPIAGEHDPLAPEHVAEIVAWLCSEAAYGLTGQVLVTHGNVVAAMRPWSVRRQVAREGNWTDTGLLDLRAALFPEEGEARQVASPVGDLFAVDPPLKESIG
ncbi:MAG: SDR family NAD(P)-dependent oxidoreductase [Solirubrobacteraceae bacterium]